MRTIKKAESIGLGKVPPQAVELEMAVLGALLLEKDSILEVIDFLTPQSFYKESHVVIFEAIIDLFSKSEPIDLLTVSQKLRQLGKLEIAGGAFYVTELTSYVASAANLAYHSRIIQEQYLKRQIIKISSKSLKDSFEDETDTFDIIGDLENEIINLSNGFSTGNIYCGSNLIKETIKHIEDASKKKDGVTGVPSGFYELDKITGGWQNTELIILAARPSMGKTDLALNLLLNGSKHGFKGAMFSLEMSKEQLMGRFLAISSEVERERIKKGNLDSDEYKRITSLGYEALKNVFIADEPILNTISLKSKARRLKMQQKIDFIVVDYLQLITSLNKGSTNDKTSDISRTLKLIAKELNIPVIALSQLSRSVETRGGAKRPMLSDLRDSGAIEQDADIVIFPFRPIYYGITETEDGTDTTQLMELDIAKNRSGSVDTVKLRYLGKYGKVVNFDQPIELKPSIQAPYKNDVFKSVNGFSHFEQDDEPLEF